jgi:hypothetical protein
LADDAFVFLGGIPVCHHEHSHALKQPAEVVETTNKSPKSVSLLFLVELLGIN